MCHSGHNRHTDSAYGAEPGGIVSFDRVLIANRGEIAIRIAKAADALGIESVAVYAPVDERSLHLVAADHVAPLPGSEPVAAYLDISALLRIAGEHGCDCVHPGYGFLAENAAFVHACAQAGIAFVGPAASTLELFGDKIRARALATSLGIPVVGDRRVLLPTRLPQPARPQRLDCRSC